MQSAQSKTGYGMTLSACLWLGLFPLLGGSYAQITYSKWLIMLILAGVTLFCFLFDLVRDHFRKKEPLRKLSFSAFIPLIVAAALFIWIVISCLCSSFGPDVWWLGKPARYEGLASQLCYFFLFVCFFFSRVHLKPVLLSAAAGVAVFFVIVLLQRNGGNPFDIYPRGTSYTRNPEFQGTIGNIDMGTGYLLLLAGLFLGELINSIRFSRSGVQNSCKQPALLTKSFFILHSSFFIALLLTLFLIITMDVQFGIISLGVLFLVTLFRFIPKKYRLVLLILLVVAVLLVVWFWPLYGGGIWELHEILHGRIRLSFGSDRIAVWYYSLLLSKENLLTGGGSGTFYTRFNHFIAENNLTIPSEQDGRPMPNVFDSPHSEYVSHLTDHGLPALILFVVLLLLSIFRRHDRGLPLLTPCSAAVLCYAIQGFFSFPVCIVAPMFWILLALSFTEQEESET
ncbi:MAG: O-antigen ligase family protein [Clostridia bacterium]|nr:O-antigen ligase family protein [Clostridia bacterium]